MMSQALLAINIPIYNRGQYLDRMLSRFLEDKYLFEKKVSLYVSDNCSEEDLFKIVNAYREQGLRVEYERNESNIGGDANILKCFRRMGGEYVWVLGSDDIPASGTIRGIIEILETTKDLGVLNLDNYSGKEGLTIYESADSFFEAIYIWITFISGNIVSSHFIPEVPLEGYVETSFSQIPLYLKAAYGSARNAVWGVNYLSGESDAKNNGGYNIFRVFCVNLLTLLKESVTAGEMPKKSYLKIKRKNYRKFIVHYAVRLLIFRKKSNFDLTDAWKMLFQTYGRTGYFYLYLCKEIVSFPVLSCYRKLLPIR